MNQTGVGNRVAGLSTRTFSPNTLAPVNARHNPIFSSLWTSLRQTEADSPKAAVRLEKYLLAPTRLIFRKFRHFHRKETKKLEKIAHEVICTIFCAGLSPWVKTYFIIPYLKNRVYFARSQMLEKVEMCIENRNTVLKFHSE